MASRYGVVIPVGPDPLDVGRMQRLVGELRVHEEPSEIRLIVVDDSPAPRSFGLDWPDQVIVRTPLWAQRRPPDVLSAHVAGTISALRHAPELEFAVKLDTDAAVIGPFSAAIRAAFEDLGLGVVGSYDRTVTGGVRDWSMWEGIINRAALPVGMIRRQGRRQLVYRSRRQRRAVRAIRDAAFRFASPGAHCLGGAYAVSGSLLRSAALDWRPWVRANLGEDVVLGLLCSHAGLRMQSLTGPGEPFALAWQGLPAPPEVLRAGGHSIVHSVKAGDLAEEAAIVRRLTRGAA